MKTIVYSMIAEAAVLLIVFAAIYIKCVAILKGAKDMMENENNMLTSERMKKAFSMIEEAREITLEESQKIKAQESKNESRDQKESAADSRNEEETENQRKRIWTVSYRVIEADEDQIRTINNTMRALGVKIQITEKEVKEI